jgi:3-hydroxyisobutyryl-CoA hydrolase
VQASLASARHSVSALSHILDGFQGEAAPFSLAPLLPAINGCFGRYEVYEICEALRTRLSGDPVAAQWAQESLQALTEGSSPTALCITLEMLKRAKTMSLAGCLQMEYQLVQQFMGGAVPDFVEGVTAKLIEKTGKPRWRPASIREVPRSLIDDIFRNRLNGAESLKFHNSTDYMDYPRTPL